MLFPFYPYTRRVYLCHVDDRVYTVSVKVFQGAPKRSALGSGPLSQGTTFRGALRPTRPRTRGEESRSFF